jgi:hypothetical protein
VQFHQHLLCTVDTGTQEHASCRLSTGLQMPITRLMPTSRSSWPLNKLIWQNQVSGQHSLVAGGADLLAVLCVTRVLALVGPALRLAVVAADRQLLRLALSLGDLCRHLVRVGSSSSSRQGVWVSGGWHRCGAAAVAVSNQQSAAATAHPPAITAWCPIFPPYHQDCFENKPSCG